MRQLVSSYLTAAKAGGRYPNIKADIAGAGTITGKDAIIECHIMIGDSSKPAYFETALALSSECRITVDRRQLVAESSITSGKKVVVYAAFNNPSGAEIGFAKLGTFYVTSYQKIDNIKGLIIASDFMLYTGVDFNPETLTYPCALSDVYEEAFSQSGLTISGNLIIDPDIKSAPYKSDKPVAQNMQGNPYTCREVIARIAGMNLGAVYIDAEEIPQFYKYQKGTLADSDIIDIKIGSETYDIDQILVFTTEERMAKKRSGYRQLPYAPRFENMDEIGEGSAWLAEIRAAAPRIRNKQWTTATVTIRGIGQIEPGDFVTAAGTTMLVTGIKYDFVNACFNETLYSYAFTEEEYYMAPQKTVDVSTGREKSGGGTTKAFDPIVAVSAPTLLKTGDFLVTTAAGDTTTVTGFSILSSGGSWEDNSNYDYGTTPGSAAAVPDKYFIVIGGGMPQVVLRSESGSWVAKAYKYGSTSSTPNTMYLDSVPTDMAQNGDVWIKINNTTDKLASAWYKAVNSEWVLQFNFGGGSGSGITIPNAIILRPEDVT